MIRVIVTGVTGMVGEGVMHEATLHPAVGEVLVIGRRSAGVSHPKVRELVLPDLFNIADLGDTIAPFDACYFCSGTTSVGKSEPEYTRMTFDLTLTVARALVAVNPGMTFCYVSGEGTDETENGRSMWARVKGRTENELRRLGFKAAYMFRPGFIRPTAGLKNAYSISTFIGPTYPLLRRLMPDHLCTLEDLGKAMINATIAGYERPILENRDIALLARRHSTSGIASA